MAEAADATPAILPHRPERVRGTRPADRRRRPPDPRRVRGATAPPRRRVAVRRAGRATTRPTSGAGRTRWLAEAQAIEAVVVTEPAHALALWKIREDGAGLAGVSLARPAYAGWEDAAVPPERARSLPSRLRRAARRSWLGRAALRALRRRLRARPDRLPADRARWAGGVPDLRRAGGNAGCRLRRVDVGRARRRPRPLRAAAGDVLPRRARTLRPGQGLLRPGQPAQPRGAGRPAAGRRRPARPKPWSAGWAASPPRCTAAPGSASAWRTPRAGSA